MRHQTFLLVYSSTKTWVNSSTQLFSSWTHLLPKKSMSISDTNQQEFAQVVNSLMSLKGCLEFETYRMQKLLLGDSPIKARCATRVRLEWSRSKALVNQVGKKKSDTRQVQSVLLQFGGQDRRGPFYTCNPCQWALINNDNVTTFRAHIAISELNYETTYKCYFQGLIILSNQKILNVQTV